MGSWPNYYFFWQVYGAHGVCVLICSGFISFTVLQFSGKKKNELSQEGFISAHGSAL